MLGLRCHGDNMALIKALQHNGLLTVVAGDQVVRFLPPLIIEDEQVDEALAILDDTIGSMDS